MDWSKPDWLKKEEKEQRKAVRIKPQPTKAEKKVAEDRDIMRALKNFINTRTDEYMVYVAGSGGTRNEFTYLADHSKRAGVDKELAWECSWPFLKELYIDPDEDSFREAFYYFHDQGVEEPKYRKYFTKKKK